MEVPVSWEDTRKVYSNCGMCSVRCPIEVTVEHGTVTWIQGNPHDGGMSTSLCAKGSAGLSFEYDSERVQYPMIRTGGRGEGGWRRAGWDEALDYIAERLQKIIDEDGGRAITLSDRGGPFNEFNKAFLKAVGSPNYFNHHAACDRNTFHSAKSIFGWGRKGTEYDIKNTRHLVLFGRNMIESIKVKEVKQLMDALDKGAKLTYIDPRASLTASKAGRFWMIRPNTEYAISLGLIHYILRNNLYDADFVKRYATGLDKLIEFIQPYTPEWAEKETGIPAGEIKDLAVELNSDRPKVMIHAGWMTARHRQSFYSSRAAAMLNVLMGNIETKGGLFIPKDVKAAGNSGLKSLTDGIPAVTEKRVDGLGWMEGRKHWEVGHGLLHLLYPAIESGEPYPVRAYIAFRHNPLVALPDPEEQKRILTKLDLIVSVDVNYSDTAWFADVILPEATYLERYSVMAATKGLKPGFQVRNRAIEPHYDSKPGWWIMTELAGRLGKGEYFPFDTITDVWEYQLQDTGLKAEDVTAKGFVQLVGDPIWNDRDKLEFKTPSGKVEFVSSVLEENGIESLNPYEPPPALPEGHFRLLFGRPAVHTHGTSQNIAYLNELLPTNTIWINSARARELGIGDGDWVEVISQDGVEKAKVQATVLDLIHPEAAFVYHGFGCRVPAKTRAFGKGMADQRFMRGLLTVYDPAGGALCLTESLVRVEKA